MNAIRLTVLLEEMHRSYNNRFAPVDILLSEIAAVGKSHVSNASASVVLKSGVTYHAKEDPEVIRAALAQFGWEVTILT